MTRFLFASLLFIGSLLGATQPPDWALPLVQAPLTAYPLSVPAEVLLNEERVEITADGRSISTRRYAVRILQRSGRSAAVARAVYLSGSDKVRDFDVWLVNPQRETLKYGKESIVDAALVGNDLYNEGRVRLAAAGDGAEPGAIFGYESVVEARLFFLQCSFDFQHTLPVRTARFSLTVPSGWSAAGTVFGPAAIAPIVSGATYTWEVNNLAYIEQEPGMPYSSPPRLGVNLVPAVSRNAASLAPQFKDWAGLALWHSELTEPQAEPDEAVRAKASALIAGAETTLAKIRAVAQFVQGINYVSVQMGIARGGGYRPHAAPEILRRLYGDCKDKTTLMRSLLRAAGIGSHAVAIFSGDPDYVRPEWVSPHQFNHMIVAVRLEQAEELPAAARLDNLGAVLFFDPTDPVTPAGELPEALQGSYGLLVASLGGALVRMPTPLADRNSLHRTASITVASDANLRVDLVETASGVPALRARRFLLRSQSERTRMLERRFSASVPGVAISSVRMSTKPSGAVETQLRIEAPRLVNVISEQTWLLRLGFVETPIPLFTAAKRVNPVQLPAVSTDDTLEVEPPDGFDFDETPGPLTVDSAYGAVSIQWTRQGRKLRMQRRFELRHAVVPASDYAALKLFLEEARVASEALVILVKR